MSQVDIIIAVILLWGAYRGWKAGLVKEVFSFIGLVLGLIVAIMLYSVVGEYFAPALGSGSIASFVSCVLAFILIWVIVPIVLGLVANILTKTIKSLHVGFFNSLMGMILGVVKYFVLISFVFSAMSYVGIISEQKKQASRLYTYVTVVGNSIYKGRSVAQESGKLEDHTVIIKVNHKDSVNAYGGKRGQRSNTRDSR